MTAPLHGLLLYFCSVWSEAFISSFVLCSGKKDQRIYESDRVCRENKICTQYLVLLRKWDFMLAKLCAWLALLLTVIGFGVPLAAEPTCHSPVAQVFLDVGTEDPEQQAGPVGAAQVGFP